MAISAVARDTVYALRREIARIEGVLPEELGESSHAGDMVFRRAGAAIPTGVEEFDAALGHGLPKASLIEIHGAATRDAGAAAGFVLALAALASKEQTEKRPLLWIGTGEIFREAGFPYAAGLTKTFGLHPEELVFAETPKLPDALWIAEEAARLTALSAVILELRGNPDRLDLTATRRLHRRAVDAGRPVFLLRQAAQGEPTAAPVRLVVSPAPAARRRTLTGLLPNSVGNPAFAVSIDKSRAARPGQFVLEWNSHDLAFQERKPADSRHLVPLSRHGTDLAAASGKVVAFDPPAKHAAAGRQPARKQYATDFSARRTG